MKNGMAIRRRMAKNYAKMVREIDKLDKLLRRMEAALQGKRRS
jgi:hypothetical protein